jgi:hypothetical protein
MFVDRVEALFNLLLVANSVDVISPMDVSLLSVAKLRMEQ